MKQDDKQQKERKKPNEEILGHAAAHLVIKDRKSGKKIVNQRG